MVQFLCFIATLGKWENGPKLEYAHKQNMLAYLQYMFVWQLTATGPIGRLNYFFPNTSVVMLEWIWNRIQDENWHSFVYIKIMIS